MGGNSGLVIRKEQYAAMKSQFPSDHRGHAYFLRNGCSCNGEIYDLDIGYAVSCKADSISDQPTTRLDAMVLKLVAEDYGVRVAPIFRTSSPLQESVNFSEFEAIFKRTQPIAANPSTTLSYFLIMDSELGMFFERCILDGMVAYRRKPVSVIEELDDHELKSLEKKRAEILALGINI